MSQLFLEHFYDEFAVQIIRKHKRGLQLAVENDVLLYLQAWAVFGQLAFYHLQKVRALRNLGQPQVRNLLFELKMLRVSENQSLSLALSELFAFTEN